jgi:CheY-like chemotaxis protein/AraC-like DNA-binding protein
VVLVVDDNDAVHGVLRLMLEDHYEVISVSSGEAGLQEVAQRRVDLVLLDLVMPAMDGWEVFERLCKMNGRRPKVIFVTGVDSSVAAVAALKLGAEDWVVKPFDESALLRQLGLLLPTARRIRIQGGELGERATLAVAASARCGVRVEYQAHTSVPPSNPNEVVVLDAAGAATEGGLRAKLGQPPINLTALSPATAAALYHVSARYSDVNVMKLARAVGLSTDSLLQRFKRDLGLTPRDWITRVRVEVVKQRLKQQPCGLSLDRLAEEVGLCDGPHLSRVFARYVRESPGLYRGNIQGNTGFVH